jgi:hypothetical protein
MDKNDKTYEWFYCLKTCGSDTDKSENDESKGRRERE